MPRHHRHLVVLENTATVHNVICCTLCSCTAFTIIGLPPDWYKDLEYRARVVRESRTVLKEMGLELPRRDRDPRLGHDRRHALHGAAGAAARTPTAGREEQLAGIVTRDAHDRRRAALTRLRQMDGIHDLGGKQGFGRGAPFARRAGVPRAVGKARQRALFARGAARHLQHGRVPPRDRAHGAAPLPVRELLRALADEPGDAAASRRASSRARSSSGAPKASSRWRCRARRDAPTRRRASASQPATASASRPTTCRATCACRATSAARPAWSSSESPAYPFPDAHAHGVAAEDEPTYDVRFRSEDLWPSSADAGARARRRVPELPRAGALGTRGASQDSSR